MLLLDQLWDSKVGFLAVRERNSCSRSATSLPGNTVRECTKLRNLGLGVVVFKERSRMS